MGSERNAPRAQLALVGDNQASSVAVPAGLVVTLCRSATPSASDVASGQGGCRRVDPSAAESGGIYGTDPGGIYSTDAGGVYSSPTLSATGLLSVPSLSSLWDNAISFIRVELAP